MRAKLLAIGVFLMAIPLFVPFRLLAHHGGASLYDMSKEVTVQATVTEYQWTNPHVEIGLDAKDDKGRVKHWIIEANSPPVMANKGWNRKSLHAGGNDQENLHPASRGRSVRPLR